MRLLPYGSILRPAVFVLLAFSSMNACPSTFHDFCATRLGASGIEVSRARIYFTGEDPGREAASLSLVQHYRRTDISTVRIDDSNEAACQHVETQHIAHNGPVARGTPQPTGDGLPNIGRAVRQVSGAVTSVAEQASRLMCRVLPC